LGALALIQYRAFTSPYLSRFSASLISRATCGAQLFKIDGHWLSGRRRRKAIERERRRGKASGIS
jgi:hypothetical protein